MHAAAGSSGAPGAQELTTSGGAARRIGRGIMSVRDKRPKAIFAKALEAVTKGNSSRVAWVTCASLGIGAGTSWVRASCHVLPPSSPDTARQAISIAITIKIAANTRRSAQHSLAPACARRSARHLCLPATGAAIVVATSPRDRNTSAPATTWHFETSRVVAQAVAGFGDARLKRGRSAATHFSPTCMPRTRDSPPRCGASYLGLRRFTISRSCSDGLRAGQA